MVRQPPFAKVLSPQGGRALVCATHAKTEYGQNEHALVVRFLEMDGWERELKRLSALCLKLEAGVTNEGEKGN